MEKGEELVAAITEVFKYKKKNPSASEEEIIQHIVRLAEAEKNNKVKMGMISTASKTVRFIDKHPRLNEREVIKEIVKEIPSIVFTINQEQIM
jgi:glycine cleavage system protein P-like pyridoxal-binding family